MSRRPWLVLLLRVWEEGGTVRVRVLVEGGERESHVVAGVPAALKLLRGLLEEFEAGASMDQEPGARLSRDGPEEE